MTRSTNSRQNCNFHPALENLEDRSVPAVIGANLVQPPDYLVLDQRFTAGLDMIQPPDYSLPAVQIDWLKVIPQDSILAEKDALKPDKIQPPDYLPVNLMPDEIQPPNYSDWLKVGPQPEPPTKPVVNGILFPVFAPKDRIGFLLPSLAPKDKIGILLPSLLPGRANEVMQKLPPKVVDMVFGEQPLAGAPDSAF